MILSSNWGTEAGVGLRRPEKIGRRPNLFIDTNMLRRLAAALGIAVAKNRIAHLRNERHLRARLPTLAAALAPDYAGKCAPIVSSPANPATLSGHGFAGIASPPIRPTGHACEFRRSCNQSFLGWSVDRFPGRHYRATSSSIESTLTQSHSATFKNRCSLRRPIEKVAALSDLAKPIELTPLESRGQV